MTDDIKPEVIKMTQDTLGKYIKKPPLTDKLLKKPPFRFLHDIITATIRDTGFLAGLYSEKEMVSDNIKDRDGKIAFLQKLIDCVNLVADKKLTVRPSKIVAGLEPTKTNELLQTIGYALNKKLNSAEAVAQLSEQTINKTKSKAKDDRKSKEKTDKAKISPSTTKISPETKKIDSKTSKKEDKVPSKNNKIKESPRSKDKTKDDKKKGSVTKITRKESKDSNNDKSPKAKSSKEKIDTPKQSPKEDIKTEQSKKPPQPEIIELTPEISMNTAESNSEVSPLPPKEFEISENVPTQEMIEKPLKIEENREKSATSAKKKSKKETPLVASQEPGLLISKEPMKEIVRPRTSLRPPSVRPSSARPGAPRLKDRNEIILPPDEFVAMGKVNVIVENFSTPDEDNEETVVVEAPPELSLQDPLPSKPEIDLPAEKGHLVNQILEQIEETTQEHKPRVEIEWQGGENRNREAASKEMQKLRDSIQTLTRSANPLGKLMNFLQEDVDSMRSELKMWIGINEKLSAEIKTQERINEESIEPLKSQLNKLEDDIKKQYELISSTQANILRNEQKIKMLLTREG